MSFYGSIGRVWVPFREFADLHGEHFVPLLRTLSNNDLAHNVRRHWGRPAEVEKEPIVFMGSNSTTVIRGNKIHKYVDIEWKDQMGSPVTWGELARLYLDHTGESFSAKKMFPYVPHKKGVQAVTIPLFFNTEHHTQRAGKFCEVDIARCYSQLLQRLSGPCVSYDRARHQFHQNTKWFWPDDSVFSSKWFGRVVAGLMQTTELHMMTYGRWTTVPSYQYFYPETMAWVTDVCHAIAHEAITQFGCLRWHTDGGVFPQTSGEEFLQYLRDMWEIEALIKYEGVGYVSDLNTYFIGKHATDRFSKDARDGYRMIVDEQNHEQKVWIDPIVKDYTLGELTHVDQVRHNLDTTWVREVFTTGASGNTQVAQSVVHCEGKEMGRSERPNRPPAPERYNSGQG